MASSREIEKLERQYKENPEGMIFAPLANAYRNSGQPERAIEILTRGLELHPHHAPARIVLGRCHLDLGDDGGAETAFTQVLELDQENVIALKALADITDRGQRYDESIRWLNYLLEVDRNNDEARDQLVRVTEAKETAPPPPPEPEHEPEPVETIEQAAEKEVEALGAAPASVLDDASPADESPAEPALREDASETADLMPPSPWMPPPLATEAADWDELIIATGPGGPEGALPEPPAEEPEPADPETPDETAVPELGSGAFRGERDFEFQVEREDDIVLRPSLQNEFQAPDAAGDLTLRPAEVNEYQTPSASEGFTLKPAEKNEFQPESASEALGAEPEPVSESEPEVEDQPASERGRFADWIAEPDRPVEDTAPAAGDEEDEWSPSGWSDAPAATAPEAAPSSPEVTPPATIPFEETTPWPGGASTEDTFDSASMIPSSEAAPDEDDVATPPVTPPAFASEMEAEPEVPQAPENEPEPEPEPSLQTPIAVSEAPAESESEDEALVVTETMAELYLSQGHRYEALEVYRVLARRSPGNVRLQEKVAALESQGTESDSPRSYAVRDTGGRSVRDFFRSLLSARPQPGAESTEYAGRDPAAAVPPTVEEGAEDDGAPVYGQPTRPAQDPLSLSAIFGEDSSPVPPAVRGQGGEGSGERSPEGFSFDSFFGNKRAKGSKPSGSVRNRPSREEEEDLDQFNQWLQGLKG